MKQYIRIQYGFGDILENTVGGGIGGAVSTGMGLLLGPLVNQQQQQNQQALTDMQVNASEKLQQNNMNLQEQYWKDTNYPAQVQQLEQAGLNPALLYAKGGAGGSTMPTTGNAGMGIAAGASANDVAKTVQNSQALGIQQQLLEAQKENIQADTAQKQAQTAKTAGADTANVQANTELTQQQIDNARQAFDNQQLQNTMQNILNYEQQASQGDRLQYIAQQAQQAKSQTQIIANDKKIQQSTVDDQIKIIQQTAIGSVLKNAATQAGINLTEQQIKQSINDIMIGWDNQGINSQQNQRAQLQQMLGIKNEAAQETFDNVIKAISAIKGTKISPLEIAH
nr:MAG: DNA pilot protein [Microviridae sp.]